jgi:hypothetical protein
MYLSRVLLLDLGGFLSFIILYTLVRTRLLRRGISPTQGRYLHSEQHKHRINAHTQISMRGVGFERMIPAFERAKTVHTLDRATTVIGDGEDYEE